MRTVTRTCLGLLLWACLSLLQVQADAIQPPVDPNLRLPEVAGLQDNQLDPETLPASGLDITVPGIGLDNAVVLAFQTTLTIYLADAQGQTLATVNWPISARNAGKPITLPIARQYLDDNLGKTLQVYYTAVQPNSAPKRSDSVALLVKAGFGAAQTLNLASRNYVVFSDNGTVRPPPSVPTYAQYTREQPGAIQYSVDNGAIARVESNGQVSVWGNGEITVTALTAAGTASSYVLSVQGVRELSLLGKGYTSTWAEAQGLATQNGYRLPSARDFQALAELYSSVPGALARIADLAPYEVWGEELGAGTAVYLDLYDDEVTSGSTDEYRRGYAAGIR